MPSTSRHHRFASIGEAFANRVESVTVQQIPNRPLLTSKAKAHLSQSSIDAGKLAEQN
jgi:hypothetical protein